MAQDWQELTRLTQGLPIIVERVRLTDKRIAIEGDFDLPPLAKLTAADQVFVMAFVRCDGSIKEMESIFGISYPTVKSRLNRIAAQLKFVEAIPATPLPPPENIPAGPNEVEGKADVIAALERGEITAQEAIERLSK